MKSLANIKKIYSFLIAILLTTTLAGCGNDYLAEREFYKAAKMLKKIQANDFAEQDAAALNQAIKAFEKIAERYPSTVKAADSLMILAELRVRQKNFDAAFSALRTVVQNFTGRKGTWASEARYKMAQIYEKKDDWNNAEKMYWETAEYHPWDPKGMYAPLYVVSHYVREGKGDNAANPAYDKALDHFQKLIKEAGPIKSAVILKYYLGLIHASNQQWQKSAETWLAMADEYPESTYAPLALLSAAESYWKSNQKDQAIKTYEKFFSKYQKHSQASEAAIRLGMFYQSTKQYDQARKWYERASQFYLDKGKQGEDRVADIKLLVGRTFQDEERWSEAEVIYKEIQSKFPSSQAAFQVPLLTAHYYDSKGQNKEADAALAEAIERYQRLEEQPDSKTSQYAKRALNAALAQKGDWNQVMQNIEKEFQNEKIPGKKGGWLFLKALIAENRLKNNNQATALYKRFVAEYPDHPLIHLAERHIESLSKASVDQS